MRVFYSVDFRALCVFLAFESFFTAREICEGTDLGLFIGYNLFT